MVLGPFDKLANLWQLKGQTGLQEYAMVHGRSRKQQSRNSHDTSDNCQHHHLLTDKSLFTNNTLEESTKKV
jgi:hypothetical protein